MKKQLIEYFVGSVLVMTAVSLIIIIQNHDDVTLPKLRIIAAIVLIGSVVLTLIRYLLLKKLLKKTIINTNNDESKKNV